MNAYEIPALRFSLPAAGAVARYRFVSANASGGIQATAATMVIGASYNQVTAGQVLEIADGIVIVEAGAAIVAGVAVQSDASGKAITFAAGLMCGIAITDAAAAGDQISIKIIN